jgi:hypothetical protein
MEEDRGFFALTSRIRDGDPYPPGANLEHLIASKKRASLKFFDLVEC